ncbi:MAG: esterase family protein [Bacteroidales bacterium]|nr:esterase family protein [Bacteroidales bacterium]
MNIEYHYWHSPNLDRNMELKVYGLTGKPFIIFPTQGGRFFQAEDKGIMQVISDFINSGKIYIVAVDTVDYESWSNKNIHPYDRGLRYIQYENYILKEVIPFCSEKHGQNNIKAGTLGFSMGGYHAANFFFKHPDIFDGVIAISGFYDLRLLVGDYSDEQVYFNSPNRFLKNLTDPVILNQIRQGKVVICSGQGAWEEEMLESTLEMKSILEQKGIPAWIDIWGHDVNHDWPWWRKMLPYFLEKIDI